MSGLQKFPRQASVGGGSCGDTSSWRQTTNRLPRRDCINASLVQKWPIIPKYRPFVPSGSCCSVRMFIELLRYLVIAIMIILVLAVKDDELHASDGNVIYKLENILLHPPDALTSRRSVRIDICSHQLRHSYKAYYASCQLLSVLESCGYIL